MIVRYFNKSKDCIFIQAICFTRHLLPYIIKMDEKRYLIYIKIKVGLGVARIVGYVHCLIMHND